MKNIILVFTLLWLVGCATLRYQEPTQGPRARVRFVSTSSSPTVLRVYDDVNCTQNETEWMRLRVGALLTSTPKRLDMPLWSYHENSAKEVYVAADKQIYGMFFGSEDRMVTMGTTTFKTIYSCGTPFSFTFSANTDYEVKFQWSPYQCLVTISQIVRNGSDWSLKEVGRFDNQVNDSNRGCLTQFKKMRLF